MGDYLYEDSVKQMNHPVCSVLRFSVSSPRLAGGGSALCVLLALQNDCAALRAPFTPPPPPHTCEFDTQDKGQKSRCTSVMRLAVSSLLEQKRDKQMSVKADVENVREVCSFHHHSLVPVPTNVLCLHPDSFLHLNQNAVCLGSRKKKYRHL